MIVGGEELTNEEIRAVFKANAQQHFWVVELGSIKVHEEEGDTFVVVEDTFFDTDHPEAERTFLVVEASGPGSFEPGIDFEEV